jgi:hypothetical protein
MTIKIEIIGTDKELDYAKVAQIKRVANVFRQDHDNVEIKWNNAERDGAPIDQRYIRETVTNY